MIEKEYKILLSSFQYEKIKQILEFSEFREQNNYYYETELFELVNKGLTTRIRAVRDEYLFQIKNKLKNKVHGVTTKEEFEQSIKEIPKVIEVEKIENILGFKLNIDSKYAYNIGVLNTKRYICYMNDCEIALDKNEYLGKTDFELEIEFCENESQALDIIDSLNLDKTMSPVGKYKRFLLEKMKHQKKVIEKYE
ncbi:CYTH domain-containing protein [Lactococcus lactis]|jgi:uncharacterized protein YjbK|uniref:Adenylate cyclase n=2 Tax=Lactococcus TaxID=1357 RepID=A0A0V8EDZ1_LACLL|nr:MULTISPECIES: CYTH domain-containing protein [Lactococcus]KEY62734.1 hypothetical protein U725_01127 [Lactococcus cremoris subsp. cremoris GE214]KSU23900.1 Adenylate cyclase [Lactococcus lactis subsp. lactis]MDU0409812.1 putative triphosphatase YjbK [Lactococcus lactis]